MDWMSAVPWSGLGWGGLRLCRWLTGHHVDALTGRCHLCRTQALDPIKD